MTSLQGSSVLLLVCVMCCWLCAEVLQAKAKVHRMGLRVFDSKHDWVYAIFKPVLKSQIKQAMERAVEDYMKDYLQVGQAARQCHSGMQIKDGACLPPPPRYVLTLRLSLCLAVVLVMLQRLDRESTVSMVGQYPASKGVHVARKQPDTLTTSTSGAQAQVRRQAGRLRGEGRRALQLAVAGWLAGVGDGRPRRQLLGWGGERCPTCQPPRARQEGRDRPRRPRCCACCDYDMFFGRS